MIAFFFSIKVEKIICREFSSSPNYNFLKPGVCCGILYIILVNVFHMPAYRANSTDLDGHSRGCFRRCLSETGCSEALIPGQTAWILFTGQVSDTVITSVNCNHIQSTKEMTINGVYSFYFLLCMILYIWLFFFL